MVNLLPRLTVVVQAAFLLLALQTVATPAGAVFPDLVEANELAARAVDVSANVFEHADALHKRFDLRDAAEDDDDEEFDELKIITVFLPEDESEEGEGNALLKRAGPTPCPANATRYIKRAVQTAAPYDKRDPNPEPRVTTKYRTKTVTVTKTIYSTVYRRCTQYIKRATTTSKRRSTTSTKKRSTTTSKRRTTTSTRKSSTSTRKSSTSTKKSSTSTRKSSTSTKSTTSTKRSTSSVKPVTTTSTTPKTTTTTKTTSSSPKTATTTRTTSSTPKTTTTTKTTSSTTKPSSASSSKPSSSTTRAVSSSSSSSSSKPSSSSSSKSSSSTTRTSTTPSSTSKTSSSSSSTKTSTSTSTSTSTKTSTSTSTKTSTTSSSTKASSSSTLSSTKTSSTSSTTNRGISSSSTSSTPLVVPTKTSSSSSSTSTTTKSSSTSTTTSSTSTSTSTSSSTTTTSSTTTSTVTPTPTPKVYNLMANYKADNFYNNHYFFTFKDPTHGLVQFVGQDEASSLGMISTTNGQVYMGYATTRIYPPTTSTTSTSTSSTSTSTTSTSSATGTVSGSSSSSSTTSSSSSAAATSSAAPIPYMKAVRVSSFQTFTTGVFILDASHMPVGCGVWPAWWTVPTNPAGGWPNGGEIDIVEGISYTSQNTYSVHTAPGCKINATENSQLGTYQLQNLTQATNCASAETSNQGCGVQSSVRNDFGVGYNNQGGGIHAMVWDPDTGIKSWFFTRANAPADIAAGQPDPTGWGTPQGSWPATNCDPAKFFFNHVSVFSNTICGDWAGDNSLWNNAWQGQSMSCAKRTGYPTCQSYVQSKDVDFSEAYWLINSVKVYQTTRTY